MSSSDATPTEHSPLLSDSASSSTLAGDPDIPPTASPPVSRLRGSILIASIGILMFILTSNVSLITTIQSPIAIDLEAFASVSWFSSTYLIAATSITPVAGRLCQIFSARNYLFASILLQILGLFITSQACTLSVFLIGRAITGIGSAAVTPVAFILITELTSAKRRGLFIGLTNTGYTTGVSLGAIVAGALEPVVGWRAIFWYQIPLALCAAVAVLFAVPRISGANQKDLMETSFSQKLARIDYLGVVTLVSAVVFFLYSLSLPVITFPPMILSAVLLLLFLLVESKFARSPIIPPRILRSRTNLLTGLATVGLMSARWSVLFYSPVYALSVRLWAPSQAGAILIPTNLGFSIGSLLVGWLHVRRAGSFYLSTLATYVLFSASLFIVARLSTAKTSTPIYLLALFCNGFITGAALTYSLAHLFYLTYARTHVIIIPLNAMFRGLSGSFGSAISGGVFTRVLKAALKSGFASRGLKDNESLISKLLGTPALVKNLFGVEREVAIEGYTTALSALLIAGSMLTLATVLLQAGTGWSSPTDAAALNETHDESLISPVTSREPIAV